MSQVTYVNEQGQLSAGMLADCGIKDVGSYKNTTGATVPFGIAVAQGSTYDSLKRIDNANNIVVGIVVHSHYENTANQVFPSTSVAFGAADTITGGIADKQVVNVLRRGRIWVQVEEAIAMGDPVYVRMTAAGAEVNGAFRNDADTGDCLLVANARWVQGASAAGVALLEIGLPAVTLT